MQLSKIFTDNMVLQANKPINFFGTGAGEVSMSMCGVCVTKTFADETWVLQFPECNYGGPYTVDATLNGEKTSFVDVYIGDVFLLAGQSNIERPLELTSFPKSDYKPNGLMRCYAPERFPEDGKTLEDDVWVACTPENVGCWSAIGYHIGMEMTLQKNIAVGFIFCFQGASVIESWLPLEIASKECYYLPKTEKNDSVYVNVRHNEPSALYNRMQQAVAPYTVSDVIWYQGESNTGKGEWKIHAALLKELIVCWRKDFMDADLRFIVVQIADYDTRNDFAWKGVQEAQMQVSKELDNVITVVSADVCESDDVHPQQKYIWQKEYIICYNLDILQGVCA